jgi:hypothetical protein
MTGGKKEKVVPLDAGMSEVGCRVNSATLDCLLWFSDEVCFFHVNGFVNKQDARFCAPKNPYRVMETSLHPAKRTVRCAISKQWIIEPTDLCGRHSNKPAVPTAN